MQRSSKSRFTVLCIQVASRSLLDPCGKCNVPVNAGGCKCDPNFAGCACPPGERTHSEWLDACLGSCYLVLHCSSSRWSAATRITTAEIRTTKAGMQIVYQQSSSAQLASKCCKQTLSSNVSAYAGGTCVAPGGGAAPASLLAGITLAFLNRVAVAFQGVASLQTLPRQEGHPQPPQEDWPRSLPSTSKE
jgi:hypothetical protein